MRSVAAGALEVGLRGVKPDDRTTPVRQRRRYNTSATAYVQHPVSSFDPGEIEKWTGQAAAPSRHEVLVGSGIGRQEQGCRGGHCRTRLAGPFPGSEGPRVKIGLSSPPSIKTETSSAAGKAKAERGAALLRQPDQLVLDDIYAATGCDAGKRAEMAGDASGIGEQAVDRHDRGDPRKQRHDRVERDTGGDQEDPGLGNPVKDAQPNILPSAPGTLYSARLASAVRLSEFVHAGLLAARTDAAAFAEKRS